MQLFLTMLVIAIASAVVLKLLERFLPSDFLAARVTSRSNHEIPARQIGGIAVVPSIIAGLLWFAASGVGDHQQLHCLVFGMGILMATGLFDDAVDLPPLPKLALQFIGASVVTYGFMLQLAVVPAAFALTNAVAIAFFLVWMTNLTNFMDGGDLVLVTGLGLPTLLLGLSAVLNILPPSGALAVAGMAGAALSGFALTNLPPARLFLGDNGSLPIGLAAGAITVSLAIEQSILAATLPFAYFITDATLTLTIRVLKGANPFSAHSCHAYQLAKRAGVSPWRIALYIGGMSVLSIAMLLFSARGILPGAIAAILAYGVAGTVYLHFRQVFIVHIRACKLRSPIGLKNSSQIGHRPD